ncbi:TRAP transporter, DctM subunit [Meinhardsimonia xiamenensis]|jgi:tripartite ATP-independent transporter DctM subunit|uniref:TRAP transporter large permease protein n=1 Tax=Meinhardsimonia xiamenensis TaxID=990712 RepID=A0A1G8YI96_9RHOB|nr:TRAP transporter large permease [Meinhardsimonia xiamenensis]PRX37317.1 tripartite ATP-independent transporter DctM subunit [Meinhardsimonia xiamenensis]SDK02609.1 TRAP transporter, DctM subunit [Meinhardsimonia xiamenensis]
MLESIIGLGAVLVLVFLRMPIAIAMGLVGFIGYMELRGFRASISMLGRLIIDTAQDYGLSVVPLFILMGLFVSRGGLAGELYRASYAFLGHMRGGLAMATIVACAGFSAICGSSLATAATMSKVAMPEMRRFGYKDRLSTASIAAGGTLGILIPPSVILVIYGLLTETSIGKLFIAGIVPGVLGVLLYLVAVRFTVMRDPEAGPAGERTPLAGRLAALREVWAVLLLFFLVIGGLYGVLNVWPINLTFSPTEAAGMGAAGAFLIALSRGSLDFRTIVQVLIETAQTTAALFAVLIGAWAFSNFVNLAGLPEGLKAMVTSAGLSPMTVMLMILLIYVILGCVFESLSMLLLTVPIFFPLVTGLGFDPVWFGIVVVVVTEISLITPPVGLNVFVLKGVVGDVSTATIFRGVTPFWIVDIIRLALLVLIPSLVLYLPNSMW